MKTKGI